jgi:hypothetical protein
MYCLFCVVLCIVCVYMCTELLPPGGYPIAVKYVISYIKHTHNTHTKKAPVQINFIYLGNKEIYCILSHIYLPFIL